MRKRPHVAKVRRFAGALVVASFVFGTGCAKIEARDLIREGNTLYRDGKYAEAIEKYDAAEELEPDGVTLYWNRACAAESQVLKMKDPEQAKARKEFADIALRDFQKWYDRTPEKTEHEATELETHRLAILDADERCDDLLQYWLDRHRAEPNEEALYKRIARQYADCGQDDKKKEWYVKRTQDFPESAKAFHELAILEFEPLFPDGESMVPYNENLSSQQRLERADLVIGLLDKATAIDSKFRDAYVWRAMTYSQKQFARQVVEDPQEWGDKIEAIRAREDSMAAWRQQKAVCDLDEIPDCPKNEIPEGACCPPPPMTPEDQAADVELKRTIEQEMKAAADAAALEEQEAADKGKKNKRRRGK
jgi:tetratricopeptide (TPR) repeat protein